VTVNDDRAAIRGVSRFVNSAPNMLSFKSLTPLPIPVGVAKDIPGIDTFETLGLVRESAYVGVSALRVL
jgi:hypothetical protein